MKHRAYSALEVKGMDDERRVITGLATSPVPDRAGDVVDQYGAKYADTIPLFLYHDSRLAVGTVKLGRPTKDGIPFTATLPKVAEAGALQTRVDEAWQMVKYKLIAAVSIGFSAVAGKVKHLKDGGLHFLESEILELSLVPIPMQSLATIDSIKSFDAGTRSALGIQRIAEGAGMAALGRNAPPTADPPSALGTKQAASGRFFYAQTKGTEMNLQEMIAARELKTARMQELGEAGFASAEDRAEFDDLEAEVEKLGDDIRVAKAQALSASTARAVDGLTQRAALASRGKSANIIVKTADPEDAFKGQSFVRRVIAKSIAHAEMVSPLDVAQARWGKSHPQLVQWIKADVTGGGSGSGEWGAELVQADARFTGDFIEFLYSKTLFDMLPLRSVPANVTIKGQDGAATGYWVGQSKGIPASKADFSAVSLTPLKVAALAVLSNELIRDSSPSAEMLVRDALAEASAQRVDMTFFSTTGASNGVSPAGILNGLTANTSEGITADDARDDLNGLYNYFAAQKNTGGLVVCTTPVIANALYNLRNALGQMEFPGMTRTGGELQGFPVYAGDNVGTGDLIMMKPSDIWKIGNGGVQVSISREATIEQDDTPTGATDSPTAMSTKFANMFQTESTAIKVVRSINYQKRRSTAVAYIGNAAYGDPASV